MSDQPFAEIDTLRKSGHVGQALSLALDAWTNNASPELVRRIHELRAVSPRARWCSPEMGLCEFVYCLAVRPDGQQAAIASMDGLVLLRDLADGSFTWVRAGEQTRALGYDPSGNSLALLDHDASRLSVVDLSTLEETFAGELPSGSGRDIAEEHIRLCWSPCGSLIAVGYPDGVMERRLVSGDAVPEAGAGWLAFDREGRALFREDSDGAFVLRDVVTLAEVRRFVAPAHTVDFPIAFQGDRIAHSVSDRGKFGVEAWDLDAGRRLLRDTSDYCPDYSLALSPKAQFLVGGSTSIERLTCWDLATGDVVLSEFASEQNELVEFVDESSFVSTGWSDRTIRTWSIPDACERQRPVGHTAEVMGVSFSPDGSRLASTSDDRTVRVWDCRTGAEVQRFESGGFSHWVGFEPSGKSVVYSRGDSVYAADIESGEVEILGKPPEGLGWGVLATDGERFVTPTGIHFLLDDRFVHFAEAPGTIDDVDLSFDSRIVLRFRCDFSEPMKEVPVFDASTGALRHRISTEGTFVGARFHPNGQSVALFEHQAHDTARIRLWDLASESTTSSFPVQPGNRMTFDTRGGRVAIYGYFDGEVRIYTVSDGRLQFLLDANFDQVREVAFSADGRWLATAADDHTVQLWELPRGEIEPPVPLDAKLVARWKLEAAGARVGELPGSAYVGTEFAQYCQP